MTPFPGVAPPPVLTIEHLWLRERSERAGERALPLNGQLGIHERIPPLPRVPARPAPDVVDQVAAEQRREREAEAERRGEEQRRGGGKQR